MTFPRFFFRHRRPIPEDDPRDRKIAGWLRDTAPPASGSAAQDPGPGLNAMVLNAIRSEARKSGSSHTQLRGEPAPALLGMAWTGASLMAVAAAWLLIILPHRLDHGPMYFAAVQPNRVPAPHVSAVPVETPDHSLTVLWIDGLEHIADTGSHREFPRRR